MTTKCTGAELKLFHNDDQFWPESAWVDDMELEVNGQTVSDNFSISSDLQPNDQVKILAGWVNGLEGGRDCSFESYFRRWRKQQSTVFLAVMVPRENVEAVKAAIESAGGKIQA